MVRPIMKDMFFLRQPSEAATAADIPVAQDLLDTLKAHRAGCVGMAANMIGIKKRIIVVSMGMTDVAMLNPVITAKSGPYDTMEGCLSLAGQRPCKRYETIAVDYRDIRFNPQHAVFRGWIAQIIQHEIDHCSGILI